MTFGRQPEVLHSREALRSRAVPNIGPIELLVLMLLVAALIVLLVVRLTRRR
jgi:hypothetical protein